MLATNQMIRKSNKKTTLKDFIRDLNVVDLCKNKYCAGTSDEVPKNQLLKTPLEKFKSKEVLGNDLSSCQEQCLCLKRTKQITLNQKSECSTRCNEHYNSKPHDESACEKKCIKNEEAIKSAAEEYYKNKKEEMAQKISDDEIEKQKTRMKLLMDQSYKKSIDNANKKFQDSVSKADKIKKDKEKEINSLTKETAAESKSIDAEKMTQGVVDIVKEIMNTEQKFPDSLVKENYAVDKLCKNDYCNKQEKEKYDQCHSECETRYQKEKESKKSECTVRCDDEQEAIKSATKEYSQKIKNNTSKEEFDTSKMEQGFFDKIQEIMGNTFPSELLYYSTEL